MQREQSDECFILIKALPHRSEKYFETVCCAGVGRDGKWRRQYPVPYRILQSDKQFKRWDWISYKFVKSKKDLRVESQKVSSHSLVVTGPIKQAERARLLNPLIRKSFKDADERGESLTLLRPKKLVLKHERKSDEDIDKETRKHAELARQYSLLDEPAEPLKACPIRFFVEWVGEDDKKRRHINDDWETSAAYNRFEREYGHAEAIKILKQKYEEQYFKAGLVMGFSTHKRRNVHFADKNQWLLVGLIRLDRDNQVDMFLGD